MNIRMQESVAVKCSKIWTQYHCIVFILAPSWLFSHLFSLTIPAVVHHYFFSTSCTYSECLPCHVIWPPVPLLLLLPRPDPGHPGYQCERSTDGWHADGEGWQCQLGGGLQSPDHHTPPHGAWQRGEVITIVHIIFFHLYPSSSTDYYTVIVAPSKDSWLSWKVVTFKVGQCWTRALVLGQLLKAQDKR